MAILRAGRLVAVEDVVTLQRRARHRLDLRFTGPPPAEELRRLDGVRDLRVRGGSVHLTVDGSLASLLACAAPYGIEDVVTHQADLEEVFLEYYSDQVRSERREDLPVPVRGVR